MIKVYTLATCPNCHAVLEWLDQQGIAYKEINAKNNSTITTTPTIEIGGERIVGFDRSKIKEALQVQK